MMDARELVQPDDPQLSLRVTKGELGIILTALMAEERFYFSVHNNGMTELCINLQQRVKDLISAPVTLVRD
jgi:hypothetical protein